MSKTNQNPMNVEAGTAEKKDKSVFFRILAALVAVLGVVALVLPLKIYPDFNTKKSVFSVLSTIGFGDNLSRLASVAVVALAAFSAISVILSVIAIIAPKKARGLLRTATLLFTIGCVWQLAATSGLSTYVKGETSIDYIVLAFTLVSLIVYCCFALARAGRGGVVSLVQFLFTAAFTVFFIDAIADAGQDKFATISDLLTVIFALVAVAALNLAISVLRIQCKKGIVFDIVRYAIQLVLAVVLFVLASGVGSDTLPLFLIVAIAISVVQIIIAIIQKRVACVKVPAGKEAKNEVAKESAEKDCKICPAEEYAEAYAYTGGPVGGVEMAEEVNPAATAGYDYYNSKSYDPFIAILTDEERNQFTELYILRCEGSMPEIPEYKVGEDNAEFFRKVFIYLGQYRDRIPDELLAKMYKYSTKVS